MLRTAATLLLATSSRAYDNGAPHSRKPPLGWSSWVALGPDAASDAAKAPIFDFCDEASVLASIDAFVSVGLYKAGYRHFHLDAAGPTSSATPPATCRRSATTFRAA